MIVIKELEHGELGDRSGLQPGDKILRINGEETKDILDFQVQSADAMLYLEVERDGEIYEVDIEREPGEGFGVDFEELRLRSCNNKCVFCFIHQMPKGMRRSLYFEDDDFRLSFLHGSYVTLTNVKDGDIERILEQGLSPQYISVHATDPELRQIMLGRNKPTVDILGRLRQLAAGGIEMHTQVVVCPGWNDGPHLERTVEDLRSLYPAVRSVALVPVGLTRHRDNLAELSPVTPDIAREYLVSIERWGKRFHAELGERFVYAADELFIITQSQLPPVEYYDAFPQLENGIGMVRSFLENWHEKKALLPSSILEPVRIAVVTGVLAERFISPIVDEIRSIDGVEVDLIVVKNNFFGHGITVSGLLTGRDIADALNDGTERDIAFVPPNCINGEGLTLDDKTVDQLSSEAGVRVVVGDYDLATSLGQYFDHHSGPSRGRGRQLSEMGYYVGRKKS
jgi:putative radical SAM enzyme (TIGR03279 family)